MAYSLLHTSCPPSAPCPSCSHPAKQFESVVSFPGVRDSRDPGVTAICFDAHVEIHLDVEEIHLDVEEIRLDVEEICFDFDLEKMSSDVDMEAA